MLLNGPIMEAPLLKVLVVDDHRDAADSTALLLECYGCEVRVSYDGPSALAEALRFGPDVGLIDYNMPGMNGCEVARRLKAWRRCQPVFLIAVSAHGSDEVRGRTSRAGFDRHLVKPAGWDAISSALAHAERTLGRPGSAWAHTSCAATACG